MPRKFKIKGGEKKHWQNMYICIRMCSSASKPCSTLRGKKKTIKPASRMYLYTCLYECLGFFLLSKEKIIGRCPQFQLSAMNLLPLCPFHLRSIPAVCYTVSGTGCRWHYRNLIRSGRQATAACLCLEQIH